MFGRNPLLQREMDEGTLPAFIKTLQDITRKRFGNHFTGGNDIVDKSVDKNIEKKRGSGAYDALDEYIEAAVYEQAFAGTRFKTEPYKQLSADLRVKLSGAVSLDPLFMADDIHLPVEKFLDELDKEIAGYFPAEKSPSR